MPPKGSQQINLQGLSIEQLQGLKDQFEGDIQSLTAGVDGLAAARTRYLDSKNYLETFKTLEAEKQAVMVPLTSSLYVPGTVKETKHVIVDVGTGYYIKHTIPRAQAFCEKRANNMTSNMDNIQAAIVEKSEQRDAVLSVLQKKYQQQRAAQQQGGQES